MTNSSLSLQLQADLQLPTRPRFVGDSTTLCHIVYFWLRKDSNEFYLDAKSTPPLLRNPLNFLPFLSPFTIHPDLHQQVPPRIVSHKTVVTPLQGGEQSLQGVGSVPGKDHQAEGQDAGDHGDA